MNYFSQQSVMGFKIRKGSKISDKPTACDISQMTMVTDKVHLPYLTTETMNLRIYEL